MIQRNSLSVYANLGLGGMIVDTDEVVARAELFKGETFYSRVGKTVRKRENRWAKRDLDLIK